MTDLTNPVAAADKPVPKRASTNAKYSQIGEKKKKGRMKRIRGFLTGESRKERKAKERAAAGKSALEGSFLDDDESVYGVDIDNMSIARSMDPAVTAGSSLLEISEQSEEGEVTDMAFLSPKPTAPALQVILLVMDPKTRRFELLQLEFDSNKALVSDVLAQIPLSVTEEQLRKQQYKGVCDRSGLEMIKTMRLSEFCKTNDVVLAIPDTMSGKECARLSRPILSDEGVITMVRAVCVCIDESIVGTEMVQWIIFQHSCCSLHYLNCSSAQVVSTRSSRHSLLPRPMISTCLRSLKKNWRTTRPQSRIGLSSWLQLLPFSFKRLRCTSLHHSSREVSCPPECG